MTRQQRLRHQFLRRYLRDARYVVWRRLGYTFVLDTTTRTAEIYR